MDKWIVSASLRYFWQLSSQLEAEQDMLKLERSRVAALEEQNKEWAAKVGLLHVL